MGAQLVWNERYNIGVETIDREHKKLFSILSKLFDFGHQEEKSHWVCQEAVKYFKEHAIQHFADEEEYMASIHYEGLQTHRHIHTNFRERTLPTLEKELERTDYSEESVSHFLSVCAGWLIGHTLIEDHAIVSGEKIKQWENLLPDEEQAVMGQTVVSLLHSMFQAVKAMLMHAAGYVARQFVERVRGCFPSLRQSEIKQEQILTYEQFQMVYEKQSPQFSMLFDTGKGYFAYCVASSDQMQSEGGAYAITENAMEEVRKYLNHDKDKKTAPERYLAKSLPPETIKKEVEHFFARRKTSEKDA